MTKDRIDFLRRRWHIAEQRRKGKAVKTKTKTKASMTWVSVDQFLLDKIAAHLAAARPRCGGPARDGAAADSAAGPGGVDAADR